MAFVCVEFIIPFRIYLPEKFYKVNLKGRFFNVKPIPIVPESVSDGVNFCGKDLELNHDIFGYAGRTKFIIILDYKLSQNSENDKNFFFDNEQCFLDESISAVNRVLEVYGDMDRNNMNEKSFHIIPIVKYDLNTLRIILVDENFDKIEGISIFKPVSSTISLNDVVERKKDVIDDIEQILLEGTIIPIYRILINSSLNYIWRGVYRLVPVESNTAFESFIPEVTKIFNKNYEYGENDGLLKKLKDLEVVINKKLEENKYDSISWFDYSGNKNGWNSLIEPNLLEWKHKCYELRKKVIHEGFNEVSRTEAIEAHNASCNAIKYIQGIFWKVIS
ncbi:hypothetical protein [Clostridium saccharoperbutylacetonicum]